jgi:hypothetical protein
MCDLGLFDSHDDGGGLALERFCPIALPEDCERLGYGFVKRLRPVVKLE